MPTDLLQAGIVVWIRGRRWRVAGVRRDRLVTRIDVTGDDTRRTFLAPFDRVVDGSDAARPVRARAQRGRARLAYLAGRTFGCRTLATAVDARADILPHQLEPALAIRAGHRRLLIADEVGLGKTVQAGLIAAEILRRDSSARLLVVQPASLIAQWSDELRERFDIESRIADRAGLDTQARTGAFGASPWQGSGVWIASLDFLKQPHVIEAMPPRPWDLVVIDEAHGACGRSDRHAAADHIARRARHVVLLTATPHSGDAERFVRLLDIGRLGIGGDEIVVFRRRRVDVGITSARRVAWHGVTLSPAEQRALTALGRFERAVLHAAGRAGRDEARLLLAVLRKRALSTMGALASSIERRLAWLASRAGGHTSDPWVQTQFDFGLSDADDIASEEDREGLRARTGLGSDVERSWLTRLAQAARLAAADESKVARLVRLVSRTHEPVIVFTEFRDSLAVVVDRLRLVRPLAILHGGLTPRERADAFDRFHTGDATALVATDVAGQGVNLQRRCRWVTSLELPWNPARLEQRIGRVDRIGQQRPVHLTLLVARHESEAGLVAHLARKVLAARQPLGDAALVDVPASEDAVRVAVIDRTPLAAPVVSGPAVAPSTRWRRSARHVARGLTRRRALVDRWRGPELAGRPLWVDRAPMRSLAAVRHTGLEPFSLSSLVLLFSVPLLDQSGALVEMHLAAVRLDHVLPGELSPRLLTQSVVEAAGRAAVQSGAPQLRRVRRLVAASVPGLVDIERAIAGTLQPAPPAEAQAGLFSTSAVRAFEVARTSATDVSRVADAAIERLRLRAQIDTGRPVLQMVWIGTP